MQSILLIEDSQDTQFLVQQALGSEVQLVCTESVSDGKMRLKENDFDLILMDIQLPDCDGFRFCAELKGQDKTKDIPVIFLTGAMDIPSKVKGFALGAEDYIVKPFNFIEFRARVMARLAKPNRRKERERRHYFEDYCFDLESQSLFLRVGDRKQEVLLTPIEFKIFYFMVRKLGQVCQRDYFLSKIWDGDPEVTDRVIDRHVSTLRKKLGAFSKRIKTIPKVGYGIDLAQKHVKRSR